MVITVTGRGLPTAAYRRSPSLRCFPAAASLLEVTEIRVCVNRSCGRQGSREMLEVLSGIAPQGISVASCGCLGRCGAGPNLVLFPGGGIVGHCGTPARAAQLIADNCRVDFDPGRNLEALSLRRKGEIELEKGNTSDAAALLTQAIELMPSGGLHLIYKTRSAVKLGMGDNYGAFEDAKEACKLAPDFPEVPPELWVNLCKYIPKLTFAKVMLCWQWKNSMLLRRLMQLLWILIHVFADPGRSRLELQNSRRNSLLRAPHPDV